MNQQNYKDYDETTVRIGQTDEQYNDYIDSLNEEPLYQQNEQLYQHNDLNELLDDKYKEINKEPSFFERVLKTTYLIAFWVFSVFTLLLNIGVDSYIARIPLILSAVFFNPRVQEEVYDRWHVPYIVQLFIASLLFVLAIEADIKFG